MKEYKTTKEEASEVLWGSVENAWKSMNREYGDNIQYADLKKKLKEWISVLLDHPTHF